jgi:hypothetical protein
LTVNVGVVLDKNYFPSRLEAAKDLPEIFELVKLAVKDQMDRERSGLMLGLTDIQGPGEFVGGYHPMGTNIIVMNRRPMSWVNRTAPELYKPYLFHVLMHEYLHTLGMEDEEQVRWKVYNTTRELFGDEHLATLLSKDIGLVFPQMMFAGANWEPEEDVDLDIVSGFDRSNTDSYIY